MRDTVTFVRHKHGDDRRTEPARYAPLSYEDELTGEHCTQCGHALRAGQRPTLFAVGPVDLETATLADKGAWYNALAVIMHESCAWPEDADA